MGDAGASLIERAVQEQKLSLYSAVNLLEESSSEKSLSVLESLLVSDAVLNSMDRSVSSWLLAVLSAKKQPSSIPAVVRFAKHRLSQVDALIGGYR